MKTDLVDVSETRKNLTVEIPSDVVNASIDRLARDLSRKARIPGFRPGKAPARVVKQRFRDQILHDVAHDLIPRAVEEALQERGVEAVDTPDIRDVRVDEGQPLTFTASFDTVPPFEPGAWESVSLRRQSAVVEEAAVNETLERLRARAAVLEPVEGRGIVAGDVATLDIERQDPSGRSDTHTDVRIEIGASANPPGFDEQLLGLEPGGARTFTVHFPAEHPSAELADQDVTYSVTVKALGRSVKPELDDAFAKTLGDFDSLDALRARVRADLKHEAQHGVERALRADLMAQIAARLPFKAPESLVEREMERRTEEFARRLFEQGVDPRQAGIDWQAFREGQREAAAQSVASALVLDETARREEIAVTEAELEQEVARYAERTERTPAAVRAALEKEGGLARVAAGLRREKTIDFVLSRATIAAS